MDIEVNEEQVYRVVIKWLNKYFGNLRPVEHNTYSESLFYVDPKNKVIMEWVPEHEDVWVDTDIWLMIESLFHLKYGEIHSIINLWLKDTYNLEGVTLLQLVGSLMKFEED